MSAEKINAWNLSEAKARFSEVVKKSKDSPQRVYVSGELAGAFINGEDLKRLEAAKMVEMMALLGKFTQAAEAEGVTEEDFERRGTIKAVSLD